MFTGITYVYGDDIVYCGGDVVNVILMKKRHPDENQDLPHI